MTGPISPGARWLRCDLHVHTPFDEEKKFGEDVRAAIDAFKKERPAKLAEIATNFVDACRAAGNGKGLDVVAVTDHNGIDGYRYLRQTFDTIAQQAREQGTPMPVILPGVEFSVGGERPIHFLVIFAADTNPETIDGAINYVFGTQERFDPKTGTPRATGQSVDSFLEKLYAYCRPTSGERRIEFVVLPAHADSNKGLDKETAGGPGRATGGELRIATSLWDEMRGHLRERVITRREWHGFQTNRPYDRLPVSYRDLLARWHAARLGREWDQLPRSEREDIKSRKHWPLIEASDPHRYEAIGQRYTWLKMEAPDVEGIRLALLDPESRLRRMEDGPPGQRYPRIERIRIRHTDFFEEMEVPFSPCLTTLIGGRGSGKSTVIECLRYGLDRVHREDFGGRDEEKVHDTVQKLLDPKAERDHGETGGTLLPKHGVEIDVVHTGRRYRIHRDQSSLTVTPDPDETGAAPVTYDVRTLLQPRILSQRQISQIARDPAAQRRELDALLDTDRRKSFEDRRRRLVDEIAEAQKARKRAEERAASLPARETELQKLKDQIAFIEQGDRKEIFEVYKRYQQERRWLDDLRRQVERAATDLEEQADFVRQCRDAAGEPPGGGRTHAWLSAIDARSREVVQATATAVSAEATKLRELLDTLGEEEATHWKPGFEKALAAYEALKEELEQKGVRFAEHRKLLQQRAQLDREVRELHGIDEELARVRQELRKARDDLAHLHEERLAWRREQARALEESDADVRLDVHGFRDTRHLEAERESWFAGTGMRDDDWRVLKSFLLDSEGSVFDRIGQLAEALRADLEATKAAGGNAPSGERSAVVRLLGAESAGRLTGHFQRALERGERMRLDEMERFVPEDLVEARVRGPNGGFKPISQGSLGQRSTAILSLLLSAGEQPLVIDQPEDDLDNQYIYDVVVDLLRKRKFSRQIIVATHNANIPVNGDAELIVGLTVSEERLGGVLCEGSIDCPEIKKQVSVIMEGSPEAFRLRQERYGY